MEWTQVVTVILGILLPMLSMMFKLQSDMHSLSRDIQQDMKDFHGRLCRLEERYIEIFQKGKK
ncbi:MAG: hypothetical protein AABY22_22525 [Nanoarchaeota archaeon]